MVFSTKSVKRGLDIAVDYGWGVDDLDDSDDEDEEDDGWGVSTAQPSGAGPPSEGEKVPEATSFEADSGGGILRRLVIPPYFRLQTWLQWSGGVNKSQTSPRKHCACSVSI